MCQADESVIQYLYTRSLAHLCDISACPVHFISGFWKKNCFKLVPNCLFVYINRCTYTNKKCILAPVFWHQKMYFCFNVPNSNFFFKNEKIAQIGQFPPRFCITARRQRKEWWDWAGLHTSQDLCINPRRLAASQFSRKL